MVNKYLKKYGNVIYIYIYMAPIWVRRSPRLRDSRCFFWNPWNTESHDSEPRGFFLEVSNMLYNCITIREIDDDDADKIWMITCLLTSYRVCILSFPRMFIDFEGYQCIPLSNSLQKTLPMTSLRWPPHLWQSNFTPTLGERSGGTRDQGGSVGPRVFVRIS